MPGVDLPRHAIAGLEHRDRIVLAARRVADDVVAWPVENPQRRLPIVLIQILARQVVVPKRVVEHRRIVHVRCEGDLEVGPLFGVGVVVAEVEFEAGRDLLQPSLGLRQASPAPHGAVQEEACAEQQRDDRDNGQCLNQCESRVPVSLIPMPFSAPHGCTPDACSPSNVLVPRIPRYGIILQPPCQTQKTLAMAGATRGYAQTMIELMPSHCPHWLGPSPLLREPCPLAHLHKAGPYPRHGTLHGLRKSLWGTRVAIVFSGGRASGGCPRRQRPQPLMPPAVSSRHWGAGALQPPPPPDKCSKG